MGAQQRRRGEEVNSSSLRGAMQALFHRQEGHTAKEKPRSSSQGIPKDAWIEFFDSFSRQHKGWLVSVEVRDPNIGSHIEAAHMPLEGISANLKGSDADAIEIMLGEAPDRHLTHSVPQPARVWFLETEQGAHEGLDIESADGSKTLVRFRAPARPELLDGEVSQGPGVL